MSINASEVKVKIKQKVYACGRAGYVSLIGEGIIYVQHYNDEPAIRYEPNQVEHF